MRAVSTLAVVSLCSAFVACAPEGSSAFVSFNIPPDGTCKVSPTPDVFISTGLYDVGDPAATTNFCRHSYFVHLLVNSNLKPNARDSTGRAEPNVLQIMEADVRLMDKDKNTLNFKTKDGSADPQRPNPFRVQTANSLFPSSGRDPSTGIASIEAIPQAYREKLTGYDGDKILAEIQIFGTTTGDVTIDFRPFVYPITICRGCLSICRGDLGTLDSSTVYGDQCPDNSAQDGRFCIDKDC
jgi:hypothetical protein